jgi:hypothetical protein
MEKEITLPNPTSLPSNQQITYPLDPVSQSVIKNFVSTFTKIPSYTTAERDKLTVLKGTIILNTTTSKLNFYTGSAWEAITSA